MIKIPWVILMTLSNFDWTDKTSVKWFIMLPTGHEGPYSLESLLQRKTSPEVKIWAEGLIEFVTLKSAVERSHQAPVFTPEINDDLPPPLPPLPIEENDEQTSAVEDGVASEAEIAPEKEANHKPKLLGVVALAVLILVFFGLTQWAKTKQEFSIRRPARMSPEISEKILKEFKFEGWDKKTFFREYVPADMSHIWLVNAGFQNCSIEASFNSVRGKLLAVEDEKVAFKTSGLLSDHITEFSNFEFSSGNKIIPGLYEMDLKATDCSWGGLAAKVGNFFQSPPSEYVTRMKVVLYHKGNIEFNNVLDKLIRRKLDLEIKNQNQEDLFWQDLQQKLQTLMAISLQIEQHLLEFVELPPTNFKKNLKIVVDNYTKKFGGTLTEFVVQNEKYFQGLEQSELSDMAKKRTYEQTIRLTSKNIGFESMKIIEELQAMKSPSKADLEKMDGKIKKQFEILKDSLNQRLIQLTEDRAGN
jgi:hypothetical protein